MCGSRLAGWLVGDVIPGVAADFSHPRAGGPEEYSEMLSGLCRFSRPQARLLIPLRYLQRPVMRSHTDLSGFLSPKTLDLSALYDGHRSFKSQLKTRLKAQLAQTQTLPSIEDAAGD